MVKKKNKSTNPLSTIEWVLSLINQIWEWIKGYPTTSWVIGTIGAGVTAMIAHFDALPNYAIVLVFLAALCLITITIERLFAIKQRLAFDPKKYVEFGQDLVEKSQEMREYIFRKYEIHDLTKTLPMEIQERMAAESKRQIDIQAVNVEFNQKFGPDILYLCRLLKELEISVPFHIGASYGRSPHQFPDFLNYVGKLLSEGYLKEAQNIDDEFGFRFTDNYLRG